MPPTARIPFIDWLKTLGIIVILLGHLSGAYTNYLAPPIYPKQLGVAFFIFVMGYSLARETRSRMEVVFHRLFEIVMWGVGIAVIVSGVTYFSRGTLAASNFLPFMGGVNVLLDNFPANPTTWYIGTYIHLLALWCLVRHVRMSNLVILLVVVFEILCRYLLMRYVGLFTAYMMLPNWVIVFAFGLRVGQGGWAPRVRPAIPILGIAAGIAWYHVAWPWMANDSFPFMLVSGPSRGVDVLVTSCLVSFLYFGWTCIAYIVFRAWTPPAWVRFLARNTLIIFIAHMPLFYWMDPVLRAAGWSYPLRSAVEMCVCLFGLAAASEALHNRFRLRECRTLIYGRIVRHARQDATVMTPS